jgi:hypothetical protein
MTPVCNLSGSVYHALDPHTFADDAPTARPQAARLNTMEVGDELEVCGIPFSGGIHWVHNNCGDTPPKSDPDGWIRKVSADGSVEQNLEASQKYCYLWPHH